MTSTLPGRQVVGDDIRTILERADPLPESRPPIYDISYRDTFWPLRAYEDRCDRIALHALLPRSGAHLLDLGAGFGRLSNEYDAFDAVSLVDTSPAMIEAARERVGADPRFTVTFADAAHLPIADASVDVVVAVRLLVHIDDPGAIFAEIARVLRPGGTLIVEFPNRRHLLSYIRYFTGRQSWSPMTSESHEYVAGHFAHHPRLVAAQLRDAGLRPDRRRSVSLFRADWLKDHVPARMLAGLEGWLQGPLGRLAPGPSMYYRATLSGPG